jgi:hypothetical protein
MSRFRRLLLIPLLGVGLLLAGLLPTHASSHREAPLISEDPVADDTDVYAFVSPDRPDTATLIGNWIPLEEPAGGPNFYKFGQDVRYQFKIDNNADAVPDVIYEFRFQTQVLNSKSFLYNTGPITSLDDSHWNVRQTYSVSRVDHGKRTMLATGLSTPPDNIGPRSTPNYAALAASAVHTLGNDGGAKVFAGKRDDPFFVDLGSVFDLAGLRPFNQAHAIKLPKANGVDGVGGFNVHSIALQVPIDRLTANGQKPTGPNDPNAVLGIWSQTERRKTKVIGNNGQQPKTSGDWVSVSRLGMPLVNEVVIPLGQKDRFNASVPAKDAQFLSFVQNPEPAQLIPVLYPGITVPPAPRNDIVSIFLTGLPGLNMVPNAKPAEYIRLNTAIPPAAHPSPLGVLAGDTAGFPNGRRLADDVTDIELRALAGATPFTPQFNKAPNNLLGDGVDANDKPFLSTFPYEATPWQGYDHTHHRVGP